MQSAQPAIDCARPSDQSHVLIKLKKIQKERERTQEIERENQRLLQRLSQIMSVNRLENYWKNPHPNFLNRVYIKEPQTKRRTQSVPARKVADDRQTGVSQQSTAKSRSCKRCPTCSGKPVTPIVVIISSIFFRNKAIKNHLIFFIMSSLCIPFNRLFLNSVYHLHRQTNHGIINY